MEGSMTIEAKSTGTSTCAQDVTLFASVEMGSTGWLITSRPGNHGKLQRARVATSDWRQLITVLHRQQKVAGAARVVCCYEAGREGFWPHRALSGAGIEAAVLDPASIPVNRRGRRTKTDRIDGETALDVIEAIDCGRHTPARVVVVLSEGQEDARQLGRTRGRMVRERTALIAYLSSALARVGVSLPAADQPGWLEHVAGTRQWSGAPLPRNLMRDIELAHERLMLVCRQIAAVEEEQRVALKACASGKTRRGKTRQAIEAWDGQASADERRLADQAEQLNRLRGIGPVISCTLSGEVFWRDFTNRRQVGSYLGLCGSEYSSGAQRRELGISKAGNRRARFVLIEAAWLWIEHQPASALTQWFHKHAPEGASRRQRRIAVVALARKLAIALWHYLAEGIVPEGAILKA
jgi:transposase